MGRLAARRLENVRERPTSDWAVGPEDEVGVRFVQTEESTTTSRPETESYRPLVRVDGRNRIGNRIRRPFQHVGEERRRLPQIGFADAAVAVEIQSILEWQRLVPIQMTCEPDEVEDVERVASDIEIADVIAADNEQQGIRRTAGRG
jgi:hypothetical protein